MALEVLKELEVPKVGVPEVEVLDGGSREEPEALETTDKMDGPNFKDPWTND